jgi:hypothetical protein
MAHFGRLESWENQRLPQEVRLFKYLAGRHPRPIALPDQNS